ncbi:MAG: TetR/AcrR family transcriptional regulator [Actinomycetota bacterium]|uniref:TetR/AcrR family transcriptional regulator n=1 Tax=Micrococcaceae TaxID=1268 RepID=UPI0024B96187|nr:TetR/AcrR family transcriptional regulator [Paenarthrobacter sp. PH39-S1]MDJ0355944.1 TetR family transcriptional regulator [Paenarthrobacter sp. PH39-S1]MDQ6740858.1 TetR/AcrR family transcriptional regulator [Actinomycetota bacterium]
MPNQPSARDRILLAFENLLINEGERSATLDAVAAAAGVSKGGLLYHFKSRDALTSGLIQKLGELAEVDFARMRQAPEGPADYYIRTSVFSETTFDRTLVAATRLAQSQDVQVSEAFTAMQSRWLELIREEVQDAAVARAILLIGDGLYYNAALFGGPQGQQERFGAEATGKLLRVVGMLKEQTPAAGNP